MKKLIILFLFIPSICFGGRYYETLFATRFDSEFDVGNYGDSTTLHNANVKLKYSTLPQANSIKAFWQMEEESGNVQDISGNGHHSTIIYGTPDYLQTGIIDYAVNFTANSSEYFSVPDHDDLTPKLATGFSVSAWIKPNTTGNAGIVSKYYPNMEWTFCLNSTDAVIWLIRNTGGGSNYRGRFTADGKIVSGNWYHIVGTYAVNGTTCAAFKIYINGVQEDKTDYTAGSFTEPWNTTDVLTIGVTEGTSYFDGIIDEPIIWQKELTPEEVSTLYASGSPTRNEDYFYLGTATSGTYTTDVIDLGAIPHSNKSLLVKEDVDDTRTITWKYSGSLDNSTWTDTATTGNGQDIGAYRYYKVQSVMATTNSDTTPSFNFIEIDPVNCRRTGKEERIRRKW